jgi:hypothetical protein
MTDMQGSPVFDLSTVFKTKNKFRKKPTGTHASTASLIYP